MNKAKKIESFALESLERLELIREELENSVQTNPNSDRLHCIKHDLKDLEKQCRKLGNLALNRKLFQLRIRIIHLTYFPHFLHLDELIKNLNIIDSIENDLEPLKKAS